MVWQVEVAAAKPDPSSSLRTLVVEGRSCKLSSVLPAHAYCGMPAPTPQLKKKMFKKKESLSLSFGMLENLR